MRVEFSKNGQNATLALLKILEEKALEYYDLSPEISEATAVFPGDTAYSRTVSLAFEKGDNLGLSHVQSTVHVGAHADAPSHYRRGGQAIDARPLDYYMGPAQVVGVSASRGRRIGPGDLKAKITAPRVLFRTESFPDPEHWNGDFNSLSPELIHALADQGVVLVGIDTPSVDPADSKPLETHQALFERDMAVLEGLVLRGVPDGLYRLVALPLRLKGADASPVRAILLK